MKRRITRTKLPSVTVKTVPNYWQLYVEATIVIDISLISLETLPSPPGSLPVHQAAEG